AAAGATPPGNPGGHRAFAPPPAGRSSKPSAAAGGRFRVAFPQQWFREWSSLSRKPYQSNFGIQSIPKFTTKTRGRIRLALFFLVLHPLHPLQGAASPEPAVNKRIEIAVHDR